jgi:aryl-alcohol dehydrogenase
MKIKAAVMYEPHGKYILEELDLAEPKKDEVLVKITACGVCHTDYGVSNRETNAGGKYPIVLGHEGAGIIIKTGDGVKGFSPGDRVCISFSYCGECYPCTTGRPYACDDMGRLNFGGYAFDGTARLTKDGQDIYNFFNQSSFATYAVTHKNNLVHVPDDVDLAVTAPMGCGIQTGAGAVFNYFKPEPGSTFVVYGCGAVGLSGLMAAKISGCSTIVGVDIVDSRLDLALELGATHVFNANNTDAVAAVKGATNGRGADYSLDGSGSGACALPALYSTANFGHCAFVGVQGDITFAPGPTLGGGHRTLTGIIEGHSYPQELIPKLIRFYKEGRFPLDKLIKYYDLDDINQAFEDSHSGATIKPVLLLKD